MHRGFSPTWHSFLVIRATAGIQAGRAAAVALGPRFRGGDDDKKVLQFERRSLRVDELAGVHDVGGIEGTLDGAHQLDLDRRFVMSDLVALEAADAVLGADRPVKLTHHTVNDVVELLPAREIRGGVGAFRLGQVEVDVAVADMAEGHRLDAGQPFGHRGGGAGYKVGDPVDRYRDVMLDRARIELRLDNRLADLPEFPGLRAALGDDAVRNQVLFERCLKQPLQKRADAALGLARRHFEQDVPGMGCRQRIDRPGHAYQRQIERRAWDQLEGGQLIGGTGAGVGEERHGILYPGEPEKHCLDFARSREQLQGRGGDDPERAFAADEELLQVVAGIVLAQAAQPVPDPPIREHDFEAQGQLARIAVAQYRDAAALVDKLPPIWQLPSAPRLSGNKRSASAAAWCKCASTQPASTVIVKLRGSIARMRFMRPRARTMLVPSSGGTPPPTRPVFPPCGTIGSLASAQIRTTAATSSVDAGRTTSRVAPRQRRRASTR